MYADILDAVLGLLPGIIPRGSLPDADSVAAYIGPGAPEAHYLTQGSLNIFNLVVNAKNRDQRAALTALSDIHAALVQRTSWPSADNWEITNIETTTAPNYLGPDESGKQHLFGSILGVQFYVKGV